MLLPLSLFQDSLHQCYFLGRHVMPPPLLRGVPSVELHTRVGVLEDEAAIVIDTDDGNITIYEIHLFS